MEPKEDKKKLTPLSPLSVTNLVLSLAITVAGFLTKDAYGDLKETTRNLVEITRSLQISTSGFATEFKVNSTEHETIKQKMISLEAEDKKIWDIVQDMRICVESVRTKQDTYHKN
jgi:hypothetical protein